MASTYIGTSGWSYDDWQGIVYPPKTPSVERLGFYAQRFDTVEVNATYYRWPQDSVFVGWRDRLPKGFVFTVKAPGNLTHRTRLNDPEEWVQRIKSGLVSLGDKRGAFLAQLPKSFECDLPRLEHFLSLVTPWQRTAVELRHPSWDREDVYAALERYGAAYCVMSGANLPCILRATADFVYVRLHGPNPKRLYVDSYSDDDLTWWAERICEWTAQNRDVYVYFNNDYSGNAIRNGETLRRLLSV